jgi:hypothetical protein
VLPYSLYFHVSDDNQVPYAGVRVKLTASGDGVVNPSEAVTDAAGFIVARWRLATQLGPNQLHVEVVGSGRPPVVVDAVGVLTPHRQRNLIPLLFGQ